MKKRLIAILLTLCMIFSLIPSMTLSASAAFWDKEEAEYQHYVPMGTSITGGYGITMSPGWWGGMMVDIVGSFGKGAYPGLIADHYGIPRENCYDGALLGTRTKEFRVLLEDDYHGDEFTEGWSQAKCGNGEAHLKEIAAEYKENLANADLITIELGSNDVFSYLVYYISEYMQVAAEDEAAEEDEDEGYYAALINTLREEQNEFLALFGLASVADSMGIYRDVLSYILELKSQAEIEFMENFNAVIKDIRDINTDAEIYVISMYNPIPYLLTHEITNNDNGSDTIKQLVLSTGETFMLSEEKTMELAELVSDAAVDKQNDYMHYLCPQSHQYTFVDVTGIDMTGSSDGSHPSYAGHDYIAQAIEAAIGENHVCHHVHTKAIGAVRPTILTLGYTGVIVCTDCGEVMSTGKIITYKEYKNQQDIGEIETDPKEEPVPGVEPPPVEDPQAEFPETPDYSVLAFTSDIHNSNGDKSASRFANWITNTQRNEGAFDFLGSCGDTGNGNGSDSGDRFWALVQKAVDAVLNSNIEYYAFTSGNHENEQGQINSGTTNPTASYFTVLGEPKTGLAPDANYKVYCFGATQAANEFLDSSIEQLDEYLAGVDKDEPVFVLSHYPLHSTGGRTIGNISSVIEVLNKYPNVIFLWGHNHTNADNQEKHYDQVFTGKIDNTPINFTYAAAGCMSDTEYSAGSASVEGKGIIVTVSDDEDDPLTEELEVPEVSLMYVDADGNPVTSPVFVDISGQSNGYEKLDTEPVTSDKIEVAAKVEAGKQYLITIKPDDDVFALDLSVDGGYTNKNSYTYSGYTGTPVIFDASGVTVENDAVWMFEDAGSGNFYIRNMLTGLYLNATYSGDGDNRGGSIFAGQAKEKWSYSGGKLKHEPTGKYLVYEVDSDVKDKPYTGNVDLFTLRSSAEAFTIYSVPEGLVELPEAPVDPSVPQPGEAKHLDVANALSAGHKYMIVSKGHALNTDPNPGYLNTDGYSYTGFDGVKLKYKSRELNSWIYENMVFECEEIKGGFALKSLMTGEYLDSVYGGSKKGGDLLLTDTPAAWRLESGKLYSVNSEKYLTYDEIDENKINEGNDELFTIRSEGNAAAVTIYEIVDMEEVHGIEEQEPLSFTPEDMTLVPEAFNDGTFVIAYGDRALATCVTGGYSLSSGYRYTGLEYRKIGLNGDSMIDPSTLTTNILWQFEKVGSNKFTIKNVFSGEYLCASFMPNEDGAKTGMLFLGDEPQAWKYSSGSLVHAQTGKNLSYETKDNVTAEFEGTLNYFTVRSSDSYTKLYFVDDPAQRGDIKTPDEHDLLGSCVAWRQVGLGSDTFALVLNNYVLGIENGSVVTKKFSSASELGALTDNYLWVIKAQGNGCTVMNAMTKQYLSVFVKNSLLSSTVSFTLSTAPYEWAFDNGLTTKVTTKPLLIKHTNTYYLTCGGGDVSLSTKKISNTLRLFKMISGGEHTIETTPIDNGVNYSCLVCGKSHNVMN